MTVTREEQYLQPGMRLGLKPDDPDRVRRAIRFADVRSGQVPPHPVVDDNLSKIPTWGLYQNNKFGDCVAPDTKVLTADLRWVTAASLQPGDELLAFDEEPMPNSGSRGRRYRSGVVEQAPVVQRPCYDLTFSDGTTVRSSAGHRWLVASTEQGKLKTQVWARTDELTTGPVKQTRVIKPLEVWEDDVSREAGYLAAAFDGEGNLEQSTSGVYANRVCYSQTENEMLDETERCLKELGFRYHHTVTSNGTAIRVDGTPRKDKHRIEVGPRSEYIRFLGSVRPQRLLPKLDLDRLGRIHGDSVALVGMEYVGEQDVVMLDTTARTYFAQGLASHNCGPTSVANFYKIVSAYLGNGVFDFTDEEVFDLYRRSGNPNFDPKTGADDNGVEMTVMLSELVRGGIGFGDRNVKALAYAKVDPTNFEEMRAAIAIFGGVLWGSDLRQNQEAQFSAHQPWHYDANSPDWGGHATVTGRYFDDPNDRNDRMWTVTWATPQACDNTFVNHSVQECYVVAFPLHLGSKSFQAGMDTNALAGAFQSITGQTLNVTPPSTPPAGPTTPPSQPPAAGDHMSPADQKLWGFLKNALVPAANEWHAAKGGN